MELPDWLDVVHREYLGDFVAAGGAAVKFVVADEDGRRLVETRLRQSAGDYGFCFAAVDAETTKIHLIDQLFFQVARQVDWDQLAQAYLWRTLPAMGYRLPNGEANAAGAGDGDGAGLSLSRLAAANEFPEPLFQTEVTRSLWQALYQDFGLAREFRLAMVRLCLAQLDPTGDPTLAEAIKQWLRGELRLISALKRALIFQRIARHNARHMLFSLARWLHLAGAGGLVLSVDIARYADATRPNERGSGLYYSTAACMDAHEVLRQLIDGTDEMEHCFVGVLAGPDFLNDDRRGLRSYQALYLRVADEVRDRYRPNPRAALVRLGAPGLSRERP